MFFNQGLSILLINTNMSTSLSLLDGPYADFNKDWFKNVSQFFINPMIIHIFFPFMTLGIDMFKVRVKRWRDAKCRRRSEYWTKARSTHEYAEMHSGS